MLKKEDIDFILESVNKAAESNPFTAMLVELSDELDKDELDIDKMINIIEKKSGFEEDKFIIGYLDAQARVNSNIMIKKGKAVVNYI